MCGCASVCVCVCVCVLTRQKKKIFLLFFSLFFLYIYEKRHKEMVAFNKQDMEIITKLTGYTFDTPTILEGTDNVAIAYGQRLIINSFIP